MKLKLPAGEFAAYLFDCDGTIADSMPLHYIAWEKALAEWNCEFDEKIFYSWGGMPVADIIATLNQLSEEDLARILTEPKDALTKQYEVLFHYDDARLNFNDCAIREIARRAKARGTGARALRSIMESLMLDIMYDLPERQPGQTYTITEPVVRGETSFFGPEGA